MRSVVVQQEVTSLRPIAWTELITQAIVMYGIQDPIVKEINTNITNEVITDMDRQFPLPVSMSHIWTMFCYKRVTQF